MTATEAPYLTQGILEIPPGLHPGIPADIYHERLPAFVSKSALDLIEKSPLHYKHWLDGGEEREPSPALAFGAAFHCAVLETERFAQHYAFAPDFGDLRLKGPREARKAWLAEHEGQEPISVDDGRLICGMLASVNKHPLVSKLMREGSPELTVRWDDRETGLPCRARADWYVSRIRTVLDLKSSQDASREAFRRDVARYRYFVQDALYRAAFAAVGEPIDHFVFVVVEKAPPHAVALYQLDARAVAKGWTAARRNIDTLAECAIRGVWPGYPTSIQELDLPPWA
jgi:hypothetical protein